MKRYYIFVCRPQFCAKGIRYPGGYRCAGYVSGAQELYSLLWDSPNISDTFSFPSSDQLYRLSDYTVSLQNRKNTSYSVSRYFLITDEHLRIRDYHEIIRNAEKKHKSGNNGCRKFRYDPVPLTGIPSRRHRYRLPATCQEKRNSTGCKETADLKACYPYAKIKISRSKRNSIPDSYSETGMSRARSRSWKDCTRKRRQYY